VPVVAGLALGVQRRGPRGCVIDVVWVFWCSVVYEGVWEGGERLLLAMEWKYSIRLVVAWTLLFVYPIDRPGTRITNTCE
jgi:hypothetical protein